METTSKTWSSSTQNNDNQYAVLAFTLVGRLRSKILTVTKFDKGNATTPMR